jgi:hypothetical protein
MHEYVTRNIAISKDAIHAIECGDAALLGDCMNRAQRSFDEGKYVQYVQKVTVVCTVGVLSNPDL